MKALVTGGAGFIGSHLTDALLTRGHAVVVLDDLSTGTLRNLGWASSRARFEFMRGTILDPSAVREAVSGCEVLYHLAAAVGVTHVLRDPLQALRTNVRGTEIVLEEAKRAGCRVVLASSSEVYGKSRDVPFVENGDRLLGPTGVARWSYSTAKAVDEHLALAYSAAGLWVSIVRYFNSYGPRLDPRGYGSVVARFVDQALRGVPLTVHGDGSQTRCFCYVSDTVRATILAAEGTTAAGQSFNIGRQEETSIAALAEMVVCLTGSDSTVLHVPYADAYGEQFEDVPRRVPDIEKARQFLGFQADTPLAAGLARTIEWFRTEGARGN